MESISLKRNAFLNTIRTLLNVVFPLITYPYITRVLTVNSIGDYDFYKSVISYFILISSFGISQYAVREGSRLKEDSKKFESFCSEIFKINMLTTAFAYVLLMVSTLIFPILRNEFMLLLIFSVSIFGTTLSIEWLYVIKEDFLYITKRSIFIQIVSIILMFIFVKTPSDYINYAVITTFSFSGTSVFNYYHSKKYVTFKFNEKTNLNKHFRGMLVFFINSVTSTIYLSSGVTIIGILSGNYYVGLYSVASKIYTIFKQLSNAILMVSMPRLSFYASDLKKKNQYENLINTILNIIIIALFPMVTGLFLLKAEIVMIIAGPNFSRSAISLGILAIASVFSLLSSFFVYGILLPNREEKKVLKTTIYSAGLNVLLNLLLIGFYQEIGAAIGILLSELLVMIMSIVYSKNILKCFKIKKSVISTFIGCILVVIVNKLSRYLVSSSIILILVESFFSIIFYTLFLYISNNEYLKKVLSVRR